MGWIIGIGMSCMFCVFVWGLCAFRLTAQEKQQKDSDQLEWLHNYIEQTSLSA